MRSALDSVTGGVGPGSADAVGVALPVASSAARRPRSGPTPPVTALRKLALAAACAACAVAATLALPGCTRDPADVLRFMIWGSPDEIRVVQGYLDEFRRVHPEILVQVEAAPTFGYSQKLQTLVHGENVPDVLYVDEQDVPWLVERRALLDLTPFIERDRTDVAPDDFYPAMWSRFRHAGGHWAVVKDFATLVLYYNRDLFDARDVPYPQPGWTWEDFLAKAKALTDRDPTNGEQYGFLIETWPEELYPWIYQAGGAVAQDDPPRWLMGAPEYVDRSAEALQFLSDLIWVHQVSPSPSVTRDQSGNALFVTGKAAMCTYGRWACMDFKNITTFEWDAVELPRHREQATMAFTVGYGVARQARDPERAWTLVKFLTSRAAQESVAHSAQAIPARRSVAESDAFQHPRVLVERGLHSTGVPHTSQVPVARFKPRFSTVPQAKNELTQGIEPLWNGSQRDGRRVTARELLVELQPKIEAILEGK